MKHGLYHSLPVATHPWERISMHLLGGLMTTRKGHDYMFVVVEQLNNMCVLMQCKSSISGQDAKNNSFNMSGYTLGYEGA